MSINDVSLTSGMRSNLLSLQGTVSLLDRTQERLSTGKKVNTAIDNPTSFFAAQSLNSRASVIDSLKDAMGQAVQTITAADKGISAITAMIEQAKGIAQSALSADESSGFATGAVTMSGISAGAGGGFDTATITLTNVQESDEVGLEVLNGLWHWFMAEDTPTTNWSFDLVPGDMNTSAINLASTINNFTWDDIGGEIYYYTAQYNAGTSTLDISKYLIADDSQVDFDADDFYVNSAASFTVTLNAAPASGDTIDIGGVTFTAEDSGTPASGEFYVSGDDLFDMHSLALAVNTYDWSGEAATFGAAIENGELVLSKIDNTTGLSVDVVAGDFDASGVTGGGSASMTLVDSTDELANLQSQYNTLLDQLTELAEDSGYKGKNLLSNDADLRQMVVKFEGTVLTVDGFDATAVGLELDDATWTAGGDIDTDIDALDAALSNLRQQSSKMSGNLSIITVRQDFSDNMINTLTEGADKLTLADANEEGANV